MAVVNKLSVQNIRSHDKFVIKLSPTITVITGSNGSGKTSLVEALYISLQGTSFKGSDSDVLRRQSDWWRIDLELESHSKQTSHQMSYIDFLINYYAVLKLCRIYELHLNTKGLID